MHKGAIFFDVDGTLVPPSSSSQHLASFLGHLDDLAAAELAYANGALDNRAVSILDAAGWRGHGVDAVAGWVAELPIAKGVDDVVAWCRRNSVAPYLATLAWQPVGDYLCARFGFDGSCGPRLVVVDGTFTGEVEAHLDELGKRDYALAVAGSLGLEPWHCAAVGDSRSDIPLCASQRRERNGRRSGVWVYFLAANASHGARLLSGRRELAEEVLDGGGLDHLGGDQLRVLAER